MKSSKKPQKKRQKKKFFLILVALFTIIIFFELIMLATQIHTKQETPTPSSYPEIQQLNSKNWNYNEYKQYFTSLAKQKGGEYAYQVLGAIQVPPRTDMHLLGHVVGDALYLQKGVQGISVCTQEFRNACSHSIVVGVLQEKGEKALNQIADICRKAPGGSGAYTMCFHGLGHGVLAYTDYDLPKAVKICQKTGTASYNYREYPECVGGTIMEIVGGGFHDMKQWEKQSNIYLTQENPLSPCNSDYISDPGTRYMCYVYLTPHFLKLVGADLGRPTDEDFKKAFTYCDLLPPDDSSNRNACYGGFGKEFIGFVLGNDIRKVNAITDNQIETISKWCLYAQDPDGIKYCLQHATSSLYWGGENSIDSAIKLCSVTSNQYKDDCFRNLINLVKTYQQTVTYKKTFCGNIPNKYQTECKQQLQIQ